MIKYKGFDGATVEQIVIMQDAIRNVANCYGSSNVDMINFEHCYMSLNLLHWKVSYMRCFSEGTRKQCMKAFIECVKMKVYYKMRTAY